MSGQLSAEQLFAELTAITTLTRSEWEDFFACTAQEQALIAQGYRDMSWAKSPDTLAKVLEVLGVLGTIAGVVSGVAGAAGAVVALKAVL